MKLRVARHTKALAPLIHFYTEILGLQILGEFKDHSNYDGVFIGLPDLDWHLEFTSSNEAPNHQPDHDDLLVFYVENNKKMQAILNRFEQNQLLPVTPQNPYWKTNGFTFEDPDGYRVVIAVIK